MRTLKYDTHAITYRELPNEVALSFAITNCPNRCLCCHSPHLREDIGNSVWEIETLLKRYDKHITAFCFLGHGSLDQIEEFTELLQQLKTKYPNIKIGLYSGFIDMVEEFIPYLAYYKVGPYIEKFGGLDSKETNQKYYQIVNGKVEDKTNLFW